MIPLYSLLTSPYLHPNPSLLFVLSLLLSHLSSLPHSPTPSFTFPSSPPHPLLLPKPFHPPPPSSPFLPSASVSPTSFSSPLPLILLYLILSCRLCLHSSPLLSLSPFLLPHPPHPSSASPSPPPTPSPSPSISCFNVSYHCPAHLLPYEYACNLRDASTQNVN